MPECSDNYYTGYAYEAGVSSWHDGVLFAARPAFMDQRMQLLRLHTLHRSLHAAAQDMEVLLRLLFELLLLLLLLHRLLTRSK